MTQNLGELDLYTWPSFQSLRVPRHGLNCRWMEEWLDSRRSRIDFPPPEVKTSSHKGQMRAGLGGIALGEAGLIVIPTW